MQYRSFVRDTFSTTHLFLSRAVPFIGLAAALRIQPVGLLELGGAGEPACLPACLPAFLPPMLAMPVPVSKADKETHGMDCCFCHLATYVGSGEMVRAAAASMLTWRCRTILRARG